MGTSPDDASIFGVGSIEVQVPGPPGEPGPPNVLTIGTVTQGPAAASITGDSPAQVLNLVIPEGPRGQKGLTGEPGGAAPLGIGTVESGTLPSATITGAVPNQKLNLVLPKGEKGDPGTSGITSYLYGAAFGFSDGYTTGLSLLPGIDIVWTQIKMDPDGLFAGFSGSNIVVPAAWNDRWFEIRANLTTQEAAGSETDTTSPTAAQKLVITHARGIAETKWRASGTGSFNRAGKEVTSAPIKLATGDVIKLTVYSSSATSPGLGAASYLVIKPLGLGI